MTSRQEAQWVLRAQLGEREAIEALFRSVQPMLARYLRAIVGAADAEDVTQDVMVLIYRKLWMLSTPDLFRPWMYRIASRAAFRYLQKRRRWPDHLRDDEALDDLPAQELAAVASRVDELLRHPRITPASRAVLASLSRRDDVGRGRGHPRCSARHREIEARLRVGDVAPTLRRGLQ